MPDDISNMKKFFEKDLGFNRTIVTMDPTIEKIKQDFTGLKEYMQKETKNSKKFILLKVYASCHGVCEDCLTSVVLNEIDPKSK